jgi:hypothetical protein
MNLLLELVLVRKASQLWGFHFLLLNRFVAVQVSNLRGEEANWQQQAMIRITNDDYKQ